MCGIAVAVAWENAESAVRQLIDGLHHRGDVTDAIVTPFRNVAMGTRRLRIVDGAHAVQPQLSHDGRFLVSFNGEIYNHMALRRELEISGVRFKTSSDTEVLACALAQWGPRALDRLNGMYAFVALDLHDGTFIAARDPFGVKPLYFMFSTTGILFCSEIRPLLASVPTGDVLVLPPGHMLTKTDYVRFKSLKSPTATGDAFSAHALDALLGAAVRSRIPPDLPFALMVSGGIDSTLIAHYARQVRPETPGYFLGSPDAPDYPYVARYAEKSGIDLRHVSIDAFETDTSAMIDQVVTTVESFEPDIVRNALCTYLLSRRIGADGFRIALSGEGADELFAGYPLLECAFSDSDAAGTFVRDQHIDAMHRNGLQRLDRCGMKFQLEVREPYLDRDLATYALGLKADVLVEDVGECGRGKWPLRELYDLYPATLPTSIRDRKKLPLNEGAGFDSTGRLSPWAIVADQTISDQAYLDGQKRFARFDLRSKEEMLYLDTLAARMDVFRVPHLAERKRLRIPQLKNMRALQAYLVDP